MLVGFHEIRRIVRQFPYMGYYMELKGWELRIFSHV